MEEKPEGIEVAGMRKGELMAALQEYKCPACGGAIAFDPGIQKMKCPYCDTEYEVETLKEFDEILKEEQPDNMRWEAPAGSQWQEGEIQGMMVYSCNSCGGEIVADETTSATACPYCDNPVVVMGQLQGVLRPDYIIPFKLDKKAATEALKKHLLGKRLLPKVFKDQNHIDEIKGLYVPFWLFDAVADGNIRYRASRVDFFSDHEYNYTRTSYYSLVRKGTANFEKVPVDGSTKMDDELMESIEPFDFKEAVDFQTAYLAGYLSEKYDVKEEESIEKANARIRQSMEDELLATITGYQDVAAEHSSIQLSHGSAKYALYPVWLLNTTWKGQKYTFAMNGQTGKFVGDLPLDKGAYWKYFGLVAVAASGIIYGLANLIL